jgi:hypothetical protein
MRSIHVGLGPFVGVPAIMLYAGVVTLGNAFYPAALQDWLSITKSGVDFMSAFIPAIDNEARWLAGGAERAARFQEFRNVIAFNWLYWLGWSALCFRNWREGIEFHKHTRRDNKRRRKAFFASLGLLLLAAPSLYFGIIGHNSILFRAPYKWPFPVYYSMLSIVCFLLVWSFLTLCWMAIAMLKHGFQANDDSDSSHSIKR